MKRQFHYKVGLISFVSFLQGRLGLIYLESLSDKTPVIAYGNPYLDNLINDKMFGTLYYEEKGFGRSDS